MRRRSIARRALTVLVGLGAALALPDCRAPTQITLRIEAIPPLRCADLRDVVIAVGTTPKDVEDRLADGFVSAKVTECGADPQAIGTLVVTPGESKGAIAVVASYRATAACRPPDYAGCIVARRLVTFVENTSLRVPIGLELACVDVPCDAFTSCRGGACFSAEVDCAPDCRSPADPPAGSSDGGGPADGAAEGSIGADAAVEGGPGGKDGASEAGGPGGPGTNRCPTSANTSVDCRNNGPNAYCCIGNTFGSCITGQCNGGSYACTGRLHCKADEYCCYAQGYGFCQVATMPCSYLNGGGYLCGDPSDCPSDRPLCDATPNGFSRCSK